MTNAVIIEKVYLLAQNIRIPRKRNKKKKKAYSRLSLIEIGFRNKINKEIKIH